jgi:5-methylcytosine-specific restriction endonuclease McrA
MKKDTHPREVTKSEGFLSDVTLQVTNGVSRLTDGPSKHTKPSVPRSETISIRPRNASSVPGSRSPGSRQQSRNGSGQRKEASKGRSVARSRGESQGQLAKAPLQPQGCPDDLVGSSTGTGGETHRYPHWVFVLAKSGQPLMPCSPRKARLLLKSGQALVVNRLPFTIRLKRLTSQNLQPVEVKLDPGSKFTGIAVVANDAPLYLAELEHRGHEISTNLGARSRCRRRRRTSNLRYRAKRFNNRIAAKRDGWLPPSLRHRLEGTRTWVRRFMGLAPVTGIAQELVKFDTQKMENPEISGVEYQHGTLHGTEVKCYLLEKWNHTCTYCGAKDVPLNVEHVHCKAHGGTDRVSNLVISCIPCNQKKGTQSIEEFLAGEPEKIRAIRAQMRAPLKDTAAVNSTRRELFRQLKLTGLPVRCGTGGRTKWNRGRFGIPKGHALDALCVGEIDRVRKWNIPVLKIKSIGHGSHQLVQTDEYGFPRTSSGPEHPRVKNFIFRGGEHKGERRSNTVIPKGTLQKVRGQTQKEKGLRLKRPYGFATGDLVRRPDGKVGRVSAAKADGSVKIQVPGELDSKGKVLHRSITWKKVILLARTNGYHLYW